MSKVASALREIALMMQFDLDYTRKQRAKEGQTTGPGSWVEQPIRMTVRPYEARIKAILEAADDLACMARALEPFAVRAKAATTIGNPDDETDTVTVTLGQLRALHAALEKARGKT